MRSARSRRRAGLAAAIVVVLSACADGGSEGASTTSTTDTSTTATTATDTSTTVVEQRYTYPPPPESPTEDAANDAAGAAIDRIVDGIRAGALDPTAVDDLMASGDARHAWFVSDLLRFFPGNDADRLVDSFETLTGVSIADDPELARSPWSSVTDHLIAWDTPAYAGYRDDKGAIFTQLEVGWKPFFDDPDATIDWRLLSWGGVFIDDRPLDDSDGCPGGCIPALDDPPTTDAAGGDWYPDERTVFGIVVGDDTLAIPLNIAEVHEMFNLSLGGRRLGIPYCTLCGSAQAFFTDDVDGAAEIPVLRTSGLLSRSNKVMYDLVTTSVFDTFTGEAVSGPLRAAGVRLEEITVVRSTWAEWKRSHPDTEIVAEDGGIGRTYQLEPLGARDADGPIFPIGDADDRLDVQEFVVGVIVPDGRSVAFASDAASATLAGGGTVESDGVELRADGDGLVAFDAATGEPLTAHEAFWFAWSQFHPDTALWDG